VMLMCLGVPARIEELEGDTATVSLEGTRRRVSVALTPDVKVGDYVLVHAGYAVAVVDEESARETIRLLEEAYGTLEEV